jgi:hypothetical protein
MHFLWVWFIALTFAAVMACVLFEGKGTQPSKEIERVYEFAKRKPLERVKSFTAIRRTEGYLEVALTNGHLDLYYRDYSDQVVDYEHCSIACRHNGRELLYVEFSSGDRRGGAVRKIVEWRERWGILNPNRPHHEAMLARRLLYDVRSVVHG